MKGLLGDYGIESCRNHLKSTWGCRKAFTVSSRYWTVSRQLANGGSPLILPAAVGARTIGRHGVERYEELYSSV
jgi:hypothetical protein